MWKECVNIQMLWYLIVGIMTTIINWGSFYILQLVINPSQDQSIVLIPQALSWVLATAFAFFANKIFVFKSRSFKKNIFWREAWTFVSARLLTFGVEELGMLLLVTIGHLDESFGSNGQMIIKIFLSVISIAINYFLSKFVIFKRKPEKEKQDKSE